MKPEHPPMPNTPLEAPNLLRLANLSYFQGDPLSASIYVFLYQLAVQRSKLDLGESPA